MDICTPLKSAASILLMGWESWKLWSTENDKDTDDPSDLESNVDSEREPSCMAAPVESSSEVDRVTGRENERASNWCSDLPCP